MKYCELLKDSEVIDLYSCVSKNTSVCPIDHSIAHINRTCENATVLAGLLDLPDKNKDLLLCSCALHDIGMGVSDKDIDSFIDASELRGYVNDHPEISKPNLIRKFHNDFSSQFVKKYWELLEIPSEQYANAIAEVGRGHRKTDLMDENLYPTGYDLGNGQCANLALLAALIRLCDELDIASDRNPDLLYDTETMEGMSEKDVFEFSKHDAIHTVNFSEDSIVVIADTDKADIADGVMEAIRTVKETLEYCLSVIQERSDFYIDCKRIKLILNNKEVEV